MENELKAAILLVLVSFVVGAYAYTLLPDTVASHWGISGEANGYMPKLFGAFLLPAILALLLVLLLVIPKIDPLRANIETFKAYYFRFVVVIMAFMFLVFVQTVLWNLGTQINFNLTMPVLLGGLFFYVGILLEKSKRNWFIGIRTPWTLSSDEVWDKTHQLGAKIFKVAGILMLFALVMPAYAFYVIIGLILVAALGTVVYSYVAYAELMKKGAGKAAGKKRD
jgi:uncharacterized membrane protein